MRVRIRILGLLFMGLAALGSVPVQARDLVVRHHEFGVSGGWSFPVADFKGAVDLTVDGFKKGFNGAKNGMNFAVNYTYFPVRFIGVGAMVDVQLNKYSENDIISSLESLGQELYPNQGIKDFYVFSKGWQNYSARFVLDFNIPLVFGLSITARGTAGALWLKSPEVNVTFQTPATEQQPATLGVFTSKTATACNFVTSGGIGVKWRIVGPLTIKVNADYHYAIPLKFKKVENIWSIGDSLGAENGEQTVSYVQKFHAISFTFGLAFAF